MTAQKYLVSFLFITHEQDYDAFAENGEYWGDVVYTNEEKMSKMLLLDDFEAHEIMKRVNKHGYSHFISRNHSFPVQELQLRNSQGQETGVVVKSLCLIIDVKPIQ